jgi:hypothetical protein
MRTTRCSAGASSTWSISRSSNCSPTCGPTPSAVSSSPAGGVDFVRAVAEARYGIPPEQVIGSSGRLQFEHSARGLALYRMAEMRSFNDRECKIENIGLHIGRRPILACGNSDGDLAMLRYIAAGAGPRLSLLIHHDDAAREFAYDRDFAFSPLAEGLDRAADYGIRVVSMRRDWDTVFPPRRIADRRAPRSSCALAADHFVYRPAMEPVKPIVRHRPLPQHWSRLAPA